MSRIIDWFRVLNLPCRDMAALISASADQALPPGKRFALRLHLLYCSACRRYKKQLAILSTAVSRLADDSPIGQLSDESRERLKRSLDC